MTTSERMRLKAALEAKRLALADELRGRIEAPGTEPDHDEPKALEQRSR